MYLFPSSLRHRSEGTDDQGSENVFKDVGDVAGQGWVAGAAVGPGREAEVEAARWEQPPGVAQATDGLSLPECTREEEASAFQGLPGWSGGVGWRGRDAGQHGRGRREVRWLTGPGVAARSPCGAE